MDKKDFKAFEDSVEFSFNDKGLLTQAFTHRSYLNENRDEGCKHNERLEFLGDAILELVVTDHLFKSFPDKAEGELTAYRSALVNTVTLAETAASVNMNEYLLLSRGEARDTGRARQYILADTFEAFVGALYLDQGYEAAKSFLSKVLLPRLHDIVAKKLWQDAKSHFQEEAQERSSVTPTYNTIKEIGPDHNKRFVIGVYLGDELIAEGEGNSKQEGEQAAAEKALAVKQW